MGKFLKKIQDTDITGFYSKRQTAIMNHYKDQPNNGTTIYSFENPNTKAARTAFIDDDYYDDITDFTWRFGYNDGHPCIFITFNNLAQYLTKGRPVRAFVCLETNTLTCGKNMSINVFNDVNSVNPDNEDITYIYLDNINIGEEYCLYITGKPFIGNIKSVWRITELYNTNREIPNDWKITLNVRPSIRFMHSGFPYTNYKALAEYIKVEYFYNDEF